MNETLKRLQEITKDCREDMHEPDQQGINASITGYHLDNAFGNRTDSDELVICLWRGTPSNEYPNYNNIESEYFNLATLIALARKARLD